MIEEFNAAEDQVASERRNRRAKPKRGLGNVVTRKRRIQADELKEQIDKRLKNEAEAARRELERLKSRSKDEKHEDRWAESLLRTVVGNQTALLRVWGYKQPVTSMLSTRLHNVVAWTDFERINVEWPLSKMPNRYDRDTVLDTVAQMKGVMQHEMGHLRFTTALPTIMEKAPPTRHAHAKVQVCWNLLEDQRMEMLVVEAVPRIASYFGTMVLNVCLSAGVGEQSWLMLAGREYFPKDMLKMSHKLFTDFCDDGGIANGGDTWYGLVQSYRAAATPQDIMVAIENALDFIEQVRATMPPSLDNHEQMGEDDADQARPEDTARGGGSLMDLFNDPKPGKNKPGKGKGKPSEDTAKGEGEGGKGEGEGEDGPAGEGESDGGSDDAGEPSIGQSDHGDGSEHNVSEGDLTDAMDQALEQFQRTTRQDSDVREMARDANMAADAAGLTDYGVGSSQPMSHELTTRAQFTAVGIEEALNSFVTQAAPIWQSRKETGVIDALAYRTRNIGDRDFRRHLDGQGNDGLDVHVSMLCDVSGSMGGGYRQSGSAPIVALSEAVYATALACRNIGIGATFTLWSSDSQNYRIWSDGNIAPVIWPCMGGTDPSKALDDLDTHNPEGASQHLVLIFTDGAWSTSFPSLRRWASTDNNRTFVLVRYGAYDGEMQKDMGADKHISIGNVEQLPGELTKALIDVLSGSEGW